MYLKKIDTGLTNNKNEIEIEYIADGLAMVSIKMDKNRDKDFYDYWRLTQTDGVPPLEIGIDGETQKIQTLVIFISQEFFDNSMKKNEMVVNCFEKNRSVIFDTDIFTKKNDYIDINEKYFLELSGNQLTCFFQSQYSFDECYQDDRVQLFFRNNLLVGFSLVNLDGKEIEIIKKSSK